MYDGEYIVYGGDGQVAPFVYCAIQKVGCSSVKKALSSLFVLKMGDNSGRYDRDVSQAMDVHDAFNDSPCQIPKRALLEGLSGGRYRHHFSFAFVRNPYDRLLSCFLQKLANEGSQGLSKGDFGGVKLYKGMPFAEFARAVCAIPDEIADSHFRSQHLTTHDTEGNALPHFVGRFESLEDDFSKVATRLGLEAKLPHMMRSNEEERHYSRFYDRTTKAVVGERYEKDLALFGYSF